MRKDDSGSARPAAGQLERLPMSHDHDLSGVDLSALLLEVWQRLQNGDTPRAGASVSVADAIWERLGKCLNVHDNRFSVQRFRDLFDAFYRFLEEPRAVIAGRTFLDLGCGAANPLGTAMLMCTLGAKHACGVDFDQPQDRERAVRGLARIADAMLQDPKQIVGDYPITRDEVERNLEGIDLAKLRYGDPGGVGSRLMLHQTAAQKLPFEDRAIDLVNSNSFLEHVEDLDGVLEELARVTSPGAFCIHGIDGSDHQHYVDPSIDRLHNLTVPGPGMHRNSNRVRPLQFPELFEKHGFRVQQIRPLRTMEVSDERIASFAEPYRSLPRHVLEVVVATFVTRRV